MGISVIASTIKKQKTKKQRTSFGGQSILEQNAECDKTITNV